MLILLATLWFIWETKYVLFWLYLWQLKDYHFGRFADHFRTHKGKQLLLDFAQIVKLLALILLFLGKWSFFYLYSIVFLIYLAQVIIFFAGILRKSVKKPVKTLKSLYLSAVSLAIVVLFILQAPRLEDYHQLFYFIGFDLLTPIIISFVVLAFQPLFVIARNNVLRKARAKMESIKKTSGLKTLAVTGSYGKTSTKEFLSVILSKKFKILNTKEHQNSEIGVAKCILNDLEPSHQIFIAEVGAYNKGKVKEVCSIVRPDMGIVTGVNVQHIALFGSMDNLLSAEGGGELAESLPQNGVLFVNGDNKFCLDLYKRAKNPVDSNKKIYSLSNKVIGSDIWAEDITVYKNYVSFVATDRAGEMMHFEVKVLGKHNVQNLLGAILIAKELGMSFGEISEACKDISQKAGGMTLQNAKHGLYVVDSSYSANPDGVVADLEYFSVFSGKRVVVMPCLIELGEKSSEIHEKIGREIAEVCDLAIITSRDKFKEIKKGAVEAGMAEKDILCLPDGRQATTQDIYSMITVFCKSGDAVLLEGRVPTELLKLLI